MQVTQNSWGDYVCEHGTAVDVHCCGCHSGFLFDVDACRCLAGELFQVSEADENDEDYGDEEGPYHDPEQCLGCGANIFCDEHDIDCPYAQDDEDEE